MKIYYTLSMWDMQGWIETRGRQKSRPYVDSGEISEMSGKRYSTLKILSVAISEARVNFRRKADMSNNYQMR